jgi:hypothetical protein
MKTHFWDRDSSTGNLLLVDPYLSWERKFSFKELQDLHAKIESA